MSKRAAGPGFAFDERYGPPPEDQNMSGEEVPRQATAAQLAKRRIIQAKKPNRARSGSPAVSISNVSNGNQQQQSQNPWTTNNFDFSFGQTQQQNGNSFQFGSSTPAPSFGAMNPAPSNGSNVFGQPVSATPSFASFTSTATQPQQNGFNSNTNSTFNQVPSSNTPSFGGFGQSQQAQQNGTSGFGGQQSSTQSSSLIFGQAQQDTNKSSTIFGGFSATQPEQDKPSNPFSSFGGSQQQEERSTTPFSGFGGTQQDKGKANTPFGSFGASQQEKDKPTPSFGGINATDSSKEKSNNPFANIGQNQAEQKNTGFAPTNIFGSKAQETGEQLNNPFAGFGRKAEDSGSKPSAIFSQASQANGNNQLFGQQNAEKEKQQVGQQTRKFSFGGDAGATQQNGLKTAAEEAKPALFSLGHSLSTTQQPQQQAQISPVSNPFGQSTASGNAGSVFSQPLQTTPTTNNIFGGLTAATQPNSGSKGLFGATAAPLPASKSGESIFSNLPKKDLSNSSKPLFSSSDPSQIYRGEDDRDEEDTTGNAQEHVQSKSTTLGTFMTTPAGAPQNNIFTQSSQAAAPKTLTGDPTADTATPAPSRSLFDRIDKDDASRRLQNPTPSNGSDETPKASLFSFPQATPVPIKPVGMSTLQQPLQSQTPASSPPKGLFQRAAAQAPAPATTVSALTHTSQSAGPVHSIPATQIRKLKSLNEGIIRHLKSQDPAKDWTSTLLYCIKASAEIRGVPVPSEVFTAPVTSASVSHTAQQQAAPPPSTELSTVLPASAPLGNSKKRSFDQDEESASQAPATEKRSKLNESVSYPKLPETASSTAKLFAAALDKPRGTDAAKVATSSGFNPSSKPMFALSQPSSTSTSSPAKPAAAALTMPVFAPATSGNNNFLSAFGNKAKDQAEKDRKKRKAEDYDSDEETEEQWEKRDRAEQQAKRKQIEEAAKSGTGFMLSETTTPASETPATPFKFGTAISNTTTTPAVLPPTTGGLFGSLSKTPANGVGQLAVPTSFSFGAKTASLDASRATSPGIATDGDVSTAGEGENADNGEPSDEVPQNESEDHTALQPSEKEANDILIEVPHATTRILVVSADDQKKKQWKSIQSGRIFLLKDKATGGVRILSKVGVGRNALNYRPIKGTKYTVHSQKPTMVTATFQDHLHNTPPKLETFFITTQSADEAKELARILTEGAANTK